MKITTLQNLGIKFIGLYCAASALSDELSDSKQIFKTGVGLLGVFVIHFHNLFRALNSNHKS
jgi:hypothetical protein